MRELFQFLQDAAHHIGMANLSPPALTADAIVFTLPPDKHQAAALLAGVYRLVCKTPEGRQAAADLGLQPAFEGGDDEGATQ